MQRQQSWQSRRLGDLACILRNPAGPHLLRIRGEASGEVEAEVVTEEEEDRAQVDGNLVVVDVVEEDELGLAMVVTTRWHATGAGAWSFGP